MEKMQFGADMNSSILVDNKGKSILILGEGPTQGLDDTKLKAEAKYRINWSCKLFFCWLPLFDTNDNLDIYKHLMKRSSHKIMLLLIEKIFIGLLTGIVNRSNHTKCV